MSDEIATTNRTRWNALAAANIQYTRPLLDLTPESARAFLDQLDLLGDVAGKEVLCLASGGGQQSAALALLGAKVTVIDLADTQLARDQEAAAHYGLTIRTVQGDMRDLRNFDADTFDLVYQAYSINFVPSVKPVLAEVARVIRPGALYRVMWHNPFTQQVAAEDWNGKGYPLAHEYVDGREVTALYETWSVEQADGTIRNVEGPRFFLHTLSTMVNTLALNGFIILRAAEYLSDGREAEPGSWHHYLRVVAPYLTLWARYRPDVFA